jgi:uncharacterized membrane protein
VKAVPLAGITTRLGGGLAREASSLMHARNIKGMPAVRDCKLIGIVACFDFIRAVAKKLGETSRAASALRQTLNQALRCRHEDISR